MTESQSSAERVRLILPLALLVAILAVSTASILIRFAQTEAPSLVIAALRLTFAVLALAPTALTRDRTQLGALTRRELLLGGLSGIFLALHFASWISSLEYTTVASSVVLVSTGPLWVALLSPFVLREQLTAPVLFGLCLALVGGIVIAVSDSCVWNGGLVCPSLAELLHARMLFGNVLALLGAWMVAGYLLIGRKLRAGMALIPYIFMVYAMAAICLLLIVAFARESLLGYGWQTYLWIVLLALVPQLIGHSTYNWALAYLTAAFVAILTLGEPIGSSVLAYFILHETPSLAVVAGGVLILLGIYLAVRGNRVTPKLSPRTAQLVDMLFEPGQQADAARRLAEECGNNLPFCGDYDEFKLERIRFAVLRLGLGDRAETQKAIEYAQRDWRDVLLWSGFGNRLGAHAEWAERMLGGAQKSTVIIMMGVSGAGKSLVGSELAISLDWVFRDGDYFHTQAARDKMARGAALTDADRADWLARLRHEISRHIAKGENLVLACSALKELYRRILQVNQDVRFVYLRGTYEQIEARLRARTGHFMPAALLHSQFEILEEPEGALVVDVSRAPNEIVAIIRKEWQL